jgi:hypothetical protein
MRATQHWGDFVLEFFFYILQNFEMLRHKLPKSLDHLKNDLKRQIMFD